MSVPSWLAEGLDGWQAQTAPETGLLQRGQVLACETTEEAGEFARLVLVLDVDPDEHAVTVCLVTNETDLAIDSDLIVRAAVMGLGLDVAVETHLMGTVWDFQLPTGRSLGSVPPEVLDEILAVEAGEPTENTDLIRGLPLGGADDPRRFFREQELAELKRLTADCERTLLDGGLAPPVPDHGPLLRHISNDRYAAYAWLLDATAGFEAGSLSATPSVATALLDAVSRMGPDPALRALLSGLTNSVLCGLRAVPPGNVPVELPADVERSHPDPEGLSAILSDGLSSGRSVMSLVTEGYLAGRHHGTLEIRARSQRCFVTCVDRPLGAAA
jgi:hypothetical protein